MKKILLPAAAVFPIVLLAVTFDLKPQNLWKETIPYGDRATLSCNAGTGVTASFSDESNASWCNKGISVKLLPKIRWDAFEKLTITGNWRTFAKIGVQLIDENGSFWSASKEVDPENTQKITFPKREILFRYNTKGKKTDASDHSFPLIRILVFGTTPAVNTGAKYVLTVSEIDFASADAKPVQTNWIDPEWASLRQDSLARPVWKQTAAPGDGGTSWYLRIHPSDDKILVQSCDMGGNYMTWDASRSYHSINHSDWTFPRISYISAADFCLAAPEVGYLGTESNGIFKTTDKGKTWTPVSTSAIEAEFKGRYPRVPISALAVNPENPDIVWAGIGYPRRYEYRGGGKRRLPNGLIFSGDGGKTWTRRAGIFPKDEMALAILFFRGFPNTLIVGTDGGVYRSDDGGRTFRSISAGLPLPTYFGGFDGVVDPKNGDITVAAALEAEYHPGKDGTVTNTGGVWLYDGNTGKWREVTGNLRFPAKLIDSLTDWKSGMAPNPWWVAGKKIAWREFLKNPEAQRLYENELFDVSKGAGKFFELWDNARKEKFVNSWTRMAEKTCGTVLPDFHTVRIDPRNTDTMYVSIFQAQLPYGLWKTTDGGKQWTQTVRAAHGWAHPRWKDYVPRDEKLFNLTQSWTERQPMNMGTPKIPMGFWEIRRFDLSKSNPEVLYFHSHRITYRSDDGGKTWTDASNRILDAKNSRFTGLGNSNMCMYGLQFHPKSPERTILWMADCGIKVSRDGCRSICALPDTMIGSNQYVQAAAFDPDDPDRFYVAFHCVDWLVGGLKGKYFLETRDFGKSFAGLRNPPDGTIQLPPKQPLFQNNITRLLIDPASPKEARRMLAAQAVLDRHSLYSGASFPREGESLGVIESTDGGKTWHPSNNGLGENREVVDLVSPDDLKTVYAAVARHPEISGTGGLYKSIDGGKNWTKLPAPLDSVTQVVPVGNRLYISGGIRPSPDNLSNNGGIFVSDNGGKSWKKLLGAPLVNNLAVNPDRPDSIFCTVEDGKVGRLIPSCGIWHSPDGGKHWDRINNGLAFPWGFICFAWHPTRKNELWLGTYGSGFYCLNDSVSGEEKEN